MNLVHKYSSVNIDDFHSSPIEYTGETNNSLDDFMTQSTRRAERQYYSPLYTNNSQEYGINDKLSPNTSEKTSPTSPGNHSRGFSQSPNNSFTNYLKCPTLKPFQTTTNLDQKLRMKMNELQLNNKKSPITILGEIMALQVKSVDYSLVSVIGENHSPIFKYKVQIDDMCAYGSGSTKKEARQKAASSFLEQLDHFIRNKAITPTTSNQTPISSNRTPIPSDRTSTSSNRTPIPSNKTPTTSTWVQTPSPWTQTTSNKTPTTSNKTPTTSTWIQPPSPWTQTTSNWTQFTSNQRPYPSNWTSTIPNQILTTSNRTPVTSNLLNNPNPIKEIKQTTLGIKSELNPIGLLQELCMARHWKLPKYEFVEMSSTHRAVCYLKSYKTEATGVGKQTAKRQAAFMMYEKVVDLQLDEMNNATALTEPSDCDFYSSLVMINLNDNNDDVEEAKRCNIMLAAKNYIDIFFRELKSSEKPFINKLKNNDFFMHGFSSSDILKKIGEQEGFNTEYVAVPSKTSRQQDIMVQLFIDCLPVCTHLGTGKTMIEAEEAAAKGALIFIKTNLDK